MILRAGRLVVAAGILMLLTTGQASGTVVLPADLDTLVRQATLIAHGRVVAVEPRLVEGRRRIDSVVRLEVVEYYKGQRGRLLEFRVPGGRFGSLRTVTIGAPGFRVGEEVVLLLGGDDERGRYPLGLWQGVFRVVTDGTPDGAPTVRPAPVLRDRDQSYRVVRGDPRRPTMRLDVFAEIVRRIAAAGRPAERRPERVP